MGIRVQASIFSFAALAVSGCVAMDAQLVASQPIGPDLVLPNFVARFVDDPQLRASGQLLIIETSEDAEVLIERYDFHHLYLIALPCGEVASQQGHYLMGWTGGLQSAEQDSDTIQWQAPRDWIAERSSVTPRADRYYYVAAVQQSEMTSLQERGLECGYLGAGAMWGGHLNSRVFSLLPPQR